MLSPLEAAKQTGKSKTAIIKAIGRGRLSAKKDEKGQWKIDPAELFRVYAPVGTPTEDKSSEVDTLRRENEWLRGQLQREQERADMAEGERRATQEKLNGFLTDQRERNGGFWSRLFGK